MIDTTTYIKHRDTLLIMLNELDVTKEYNVHSPVEPLKTALYRIERIIEARLGK